MSEYYLNANCNTVHLGGFSDRIRPALIADDGDRIHVETYSGFYLSDRAPDEFFTPEFREICDRLPPERKAGPGPHLLTGPIYINGAEPGDILEIELEAITPRLPIGFNAIRAGWGALPERFADSTLRFLSLNLEQNTASLPGHPQLNIPLHPFFGILGVASPSEARSSVPPGSFGGNMDNRDLQVGSRIFLPVLVPGAFFSIGDGHAAQGHGEVNGTAIETSMNGTIRLRLHKQFPLSTPMAKTPSHLITMGFAETLDGALQQALERAIEAIAYGTELTREEAYVLCSIAVNFQITQVVNSPQKGVHGLVPLSIFPEGFRL
ncbi:acetamidase/formamidase family protein [Roseofilum casamattae]|uniref:Acetamidase/formamidase family protein n=1 Tax=Roseofilum casamattae BLCC-M143 TaxID=3022442 RepID=A0ABT7BUS4_9CYAN|nr:acetamidase/formamidase family protein [Roseofilum casamattae]MDJ1182226.1 acetamidase/formamidase family protein [Roseofilum casamattae BLCC-M143]